MVTAGGGRAIGFGCSLVGEPAEVPFQKPPLPLAVLNVGLGMPELIGDETVDACVMLMIELRGVVLLVVIESIESRLSLLGASDALDMYEDVEIRRCDLIERAEESSCSEV